MLKQRPPSAHHLEDDQEEVPDEEEAGEPPSASACPGACLEAPLIQATDSKDSLAPLIQMVAGEAHVLTQVQRLEPEEEEQYDA